MLVNPVFPAADRTLPHAITEVERLGSYFNANEPVAARLPDTLTRHPILKVLGQAWDGWAKGGTADHMAQMWLHPAEPVRRAAVAGGAELVNQLADVARAVREKLDFEDFGGMLRKQGSRILVEFCYGTNTAAAAAAALIPDDVDMASTEETIVDFLINLHKALQDENRSCATVGRQARRSWWH
ncbi:hypothetical protein BJX68DRAFT_263292 [Aspergillus pseudodeflectus]|uniref:Uncharacterized protein n=1 Tax=Aspergillus pseudodeflectus TaxID=176178 RepID=A0ABR4KZS1_9EURO